MTHTRIGGVLHCDADLAEIERLTAELAEAITIKRATYETCKLAWAESDALRADAERLKRELIRRGFWTEAPCVICGYDGDGYYQTETHECAGISASRSDQQVKP